MLFLVRNKRYRNHIKNVRQRIPCHSCKWLISRQAIEVFSFHNQFWFLAADLVGLNLSIHSNQPQAFKITFENLICKACFDSFSFFNQFV
jgi:hypothetical protein